MYHRCARTYTATLRLLVGRKKHSSGIFIMQPCTCTCMYMYISLTSITMLGLVCTCILHQPHLPSKKKNLPKKNMMRSLMLCIKFACPPPKKKKKGLGRDNTCYITICTISTLYIEGGAMSGFSDALID